MPVYTYQCENCGVRFEHTAKFSDPQLTRCPECGKKSLRKVFVPVGIVFKGSGFYATDHRSPSGASKFNAEAKSAESGKSSESSSTSSSSTSSDSSSTTSSSTASSEAKSSPPSEKK